MNILIDGQTLETEEINRGIGVYFKNVLFHMIRQGIGDIWYVTVSRQSSVGQLDKWTAARLNPIVDDIFAPSFDYKREDEYTDKLNEVIKKFHIDCFWTPNPLMVNVLFPTGKIFCPFFLTIHDLIPYVMPIKEWSEHVKKEYNRRLDYIKDVNLICVSEATRKDVLKRAGSQASTFVTLEAANNNLFYRRRYSVNTTDCVKIVFTGGFDYRKNIYGAVAAFAKAKQKITSKKLQFYIVCKYTQQEKEEFEGHLVDLGIQEDVILTGFVTDEALAELYYTADVFFFPSFYEGFGLPLLEAMLGGAFILSADNSSLPEVCGNYALYCRADNLENMADLLVQAINQSLSESLEDKNRRQDYALGFSWEKTAAQTQEAFRYKVYPKIKEETKKRIAIVTPWPNQQTGIANYVYRLMPFWARYWDVDIFVDTTVESSIDLIPNVYGGRYIIGELDKRHCDYDEIIYQIGNNAAFHSAIYKMFKKYNGVVEIHDFILNPFFYHAFFLKGDKDTYCQALIDGYGEEGRKHSEDMLNGLSGSDGVRFPMAHSASRIAKKTIVHNEWSYQRLDIDIQKYYVPLASFEPDQMSDNERYKVYCNVCRKIVYTEADTVVGVLGWINKNKRPETIIKSIISLKEMGYHVKLVFLGESNFDEIEKMITENHLEDFVKITGYLNRQEYEVGLYMCDIIINLRYPTMGEASGTLCEAFKAGKAVIVTASGQYLEYPDEVCWKLPLGEAEVWTLVEMLKYLHDHKEVRIQMGINAKKYADEIINGENIARLYNYIIG